MDAPRITADSVLRHYEVIRSLGRGGMGEVFLARDTRLGRLVAIKLLTHHGGELAEHADRFLIEARATAQLSHENIVVIHELGEHEGTPFMVLEYLKGRTLQEKLHERRQYGRAGPARAALGGDPDDDGEGPPDGAAMGLAPGRAVDLMIPVVRALVCAHERGIVHRDLKPSNIMVTDTGTVKVLDFGLAKLLDRPEGPMSARRAAAPDARVSLSEGAPVTEAGKMLGTKPYMSPEQWLLGPVDHRTDLWAVGILLAELLLGRHPLAPLSLYELATIGRLDLPMPSLRKLCPGIGKLASITDRCLIKAIHDRMGSARELLAELEGLVPGARGASAADTGEQGHNPYPGLAAFQTGDAARFFGRKTAVAEVVAQLAEQPLLAIVGPSGAGKSSFVRAGVIPALDRSGESWEAVTVRPGSQPVAALAELLLEDAFSTSSAELTRSARPSPSVAEDREGLAERLRAEPGLLGARMRAHARSKRKRLLLFVDQAEELYTLAPEQDRAAFFACLSGVADDVGSPLRAVLAIRSDFLDRMAEAQATSSTLRRGILLLPAMDREGLREALLRPLEDVDHRFESPEFASEMLDALENTAAALPLLSFTASRLWLQRDRVQRILTEASYRRMGGIGGALAGHADAVLGAMTAAERKLSRAALLRLVTPERTRAVGVVRELRELGSAPADMDRVLARLVDARLLTVEGGESEATVELVHESLISGWPALAGWVAENQADAAFLARLRHAAREWAGGGHSEDLLWHGPSAEGAERWYVGYQGDLAPVEKRYLEAVVALSERSRRARRALAAAVIAVLSVVAVVVSILAVRAGRSADSANDALAKAQIAEKNATNNAIEASDARLLAGFRELKTRGQLAWGVKLLAAVQKPEAARGWVALASDAVAASTLFVTLRGHEKEVRAALWSHDGKRVATASDDTTARLWNADGTGSPVVLAGHTGPVRFAVFSPDDRRVLTTAEDGTARIWNADGSGSPVVIDGHLLPVCAPAWSPDGKRIVAASADHRVRVWNADGTGMIELEGHTMPVVVTSFLPDGERVLTASWDRTARVFRADGRGKPVVFTGHRDAVLFAAPSPDGSHLVTTSADRTVRVWETSGKRPPVVLEGHADNVRHAAWSSDGKRVATASDDRTARLWNADGKGEPVLFAGHGREVTFVAFRPDGRYLVTASRDQTARVWPAEGGTALVLAGHEVAVVTAEWSPDGSRVLTAAAEGSRRSLDATARIFRLAQLESLPRGRPAFFHSASIAAGGEVVVSAHDDRTARLWRVDGRGEPRTFKGHQEWLADALPSPDGTRVVTVAFDKTARITRVDGAGEPVVLTGATAAVRAAAWSPDGSRVVLASDDHTARIHPADGKGQVVALSGHGDALTAVAWSPDGQRIATASLDHTARIFRADGKGEPTVLGGHGGGLHSAAWSPDGARLVTTSEDGTALVWDADSGALLVQLDHGSPVLRAIWSPDGKQIATSPVKGGVRLWRADGAGEPIVIETAAPALAMAFQAGGEKLLTVLEDDTTRSFTIDPVALQRELEAANADCLPPAMRATYLGEPADRAEHRSAECERRYARITSFNEGRGP